MTDTDVARPPFDPELEPVLTELLGGQPRLDLSAETLTALRSGGDVIAMPPIEERLAGRAIAYEDRTVPGPAGAPEITVAIFRTTRTVSGPAAGIYHTHGGGMIMGDRLMGVDGFFDLVEAGEAVVVSVEYRLAPDHPDPAPVEDCYAGLLWTADHADELGLDPDRLIIAGGSAGGGLAAGTALLARDRNGPRLAGQLLICPMLDDRNVTVSSHQYDGVGLWDRQNNLFGWSALLGDDHANRDDISPYAAPARAADLSGLPPAFIDAGSAEVFRDEAVDYASRIWAAGGQAELHIWAGGFHGFSMVAQAGVSVAAGAAVDSWLRRALRL